MLLSSCSSTPVSKIEQEIIAEVPEAEFISAFSSEEVAVGASSEYLHKNISNTRYAASNVLDGDYDSGWCPHYWDSSPELTISFPEKVKLKDLRIVGGFPKKDLIKTIEVYYDDDATPRGEMNFKDELAIHVFTMPEGEVKDLRLRIRDVYKLTSHSSTCIPEISFWENAENTAYALSKASVSMSLSNVLITLGDNLTQCGTLNEKNFNISKTNEYIYYSSYYGAYYIYRPENRTVIQSANGDVQIAARVNYARAGDKIDMKLSRKTWLGYDEENNYDKYEFEVIGNYDLDVETCYGYAFVKVDPEIVPEPMSIYRAEFFKQGKLIGMAEFSWAE